MIHLQSFVFIYIGAFFLIIFIYFLGFNESRIVLLFSQTLDSLFGWHFLKDYWINFHLKIWRCRIFIHCIGRTWDRNFLRLCIMFFQHTVNREINNNLCRWYLHNIGNGIGLIRCRLSFPITDLIRSVMAKANISKPSGKIVWEIQYVSKGNFRDVGVRE